MLGNLLKYNAPINANIICDAARNTITTGKPAIKNPVAVPNATKADVEGEINIDIKIATWLASVKDAGSSVILIGEIIGIIIPIAQKNADMTIELR